MHCNLNSYLIGTFQENKDLRVNSSAVPRNTRPRRTGIWYATSLPCSPTTNTYFNLDRWVNGTYQTISKRYDKTDRCHLKHTLWNNPFIFIAKTFLSKILGEERGGIKFHFYSVKPTMALYINLGNTVDLRLIFETHQQPNSAESHLKSIKRVQLWTLNTLSTEN